MAILLFDSGRNNSQARTRSAHELTRATGTRLLSLRSGRDPRSSIALTGAAHTPRTATAVLLFDSGRNSSQARTRSAHELTPSDRHAAALSPIRTRSAKLHSAHRCSSHTQGGHGRPFVRLRKKQQPGTYQERPRAEAQAPSARCSLRSGQIRRQKERTTLERWSLKKSLTVYPMIERSDCSRWNWNNNAKKRYC